MSHSPAILDSTAASPRAASAAPRRVIVNADDWGSSVEITDRILDCILHGVVSSTSAMVWMADSERAAALALQHNVDAGLHLNLTEPFTSASVSPELLRRHAEVSRVLRAHRYAPVLFHAALASSFEYVVRCQLDEYERLYGAAAARIDGHHHMHLSTNVLLQRLLPSRTIVRRNFTFASGEKGGLNRLYRGMQDRALERRQWSTDFFYDLRPMQPERLKRILDRSRTATVEIEAHPGRAEEFEFLKEGGLPACAEDVRVLRGYHLGEPGCAARVATGELEDRASRRTPHIGVCICTYKRPGMLQRLLADLAEQRTDGAFTYSIAIADNDEARSAEAIVAGMGAGFPVALKYVAEPARGIARARNRVVSSAEGDYLAFIDDDEFPERDWLLNLLRTCTRYDVDGVLGPVKRYLEPEAPAWLKRSSLYDRPVNPSGLQVKWRESRTGNVLIRRAILEGEDAPFRPEFRAGEDQDFFRRKMERGYRFVWSSNAVVHEVLPRARWKRSYYVRKAMLQGAFAARQPDCGAISVLKSMVAVPLYAIALPFALLAGQHQFMTLLTKLSDHAGKLLSKMHIHPIREEYVSE